MGCGRLWAFNLDTDNYQRKNGEPGSLFGFSMALHWQLAPEDKRFLLVGAPRAKAMNGQKSKVTGGLYGCDMSSSSTDCVRLTFDNTEDTKRESKENQWMGVTVNSQGPGGKIVTCAHRYQRRHNVKTSSESRDIIGRCFVLSQNLEIDENAAEDGDGWHFCDQRPRGHESFGSCQQGLSATFDKDYHYFIFGAPGAYNWKGIVRLEQKNATLIDLGIYEDGPFEVGDEREKNADLVPAPANSYMGFSLDSGMSLTKNRKLTVVAGAPRAYHSGAVMLLKKGEGANNILLEEYTLKGEGLASSFGYDLTVLDLNGDGWQDIVVGAPQYFEKDGEIGGAVYVYVNKEGIWNNVKPIRIDGPKDSMFGLAVENLGDINMDGYQDFAVGAPYEGDGSGKVYIYFGSDAGLRSEKANQVLSGQTVGVRLFGYSLAGNMDLDKNSYPDLAVGSLSDSVFVFKTRPVINIKKVITFTPKEIDFTKKNCDSGFCLEVEVCFTYTANPASYTPKLTVEYILQADADHRSNGLTSRATFPGSSDSDKGTIVMNSKGAEKCTKRQLAIQENIRDKLHGIPIEVTVDIKDAKRKRRQSSGPLPPILDALVPMTTRSVVNFLKEGCGSDNVCQSNLQMQCQYGSRASDKDPFVPLKKGEDGMPLVSLSNQKDITLEVKVTNLGGDDAHEASLVVSFPPSLTYSAHHVPGDKRVSCRANNDGSELDCDLGNPFSRDSEMTIYIILGTSRISNDNSDLEIDLQLNTTSNQVIAPVKAKAKVAIMLQLMLSGQIQPSQVYYTGKVKDEAAMKTESDAGPAITHQFRIVNLGKRLTGLDSATLNIRWPKQAAPGKRLLYLMRISSTGVENIECTPKDEINRLGLESSSNRRRRSAENSQGNIEGKISRYEGKKSLSLSCDSGADCVTIKCPLQGLDSNAVITIHSRLWNSTFIEHYSELHHVEVIVTASLHLDSSKKNTILENTQTQLKLTVFPVMRAAQHGAVSWWIILLSILLFLLLLGLLAFLLWKCGFFNRAKYEDKVPSYNAVRIKREERNINAGNGNWATLEKKPWMTTWHDGKHYS
ncbi:integrin alpha-6-like [Limanda limanda]|uniref:integrin alpha-6-like n=1 Tax=Limanda limanda TaxID=27771 RepID=UPI0029C951E8|nr:integrin alpha-6-like [Limanda limanda]